MTSHPTIIMQNRSFQIYSPCFTLHSVSIGLQCLFATKLYSIYTQQNPNSHNWWDLWIAKWLVWCSQTVTYLISYNMKGIISKVHQYHCVKNLGKIKTVWYHQREKNKLHSSSAYSSVSGSHLFFSVLILREYRKINDGKKTPTLTIFSLF